MPHRPCRPDQLMYQLTRDCVRQIHVVVHLEAQLVISLEFLAHNVLSVPELDDNTLLIDSQPILDLILKSFDDKSRVTLKVFDRLPANPAIVLFYQRHRHIVMIQRHDRLNAVCKAGIDQVTVKIYALLIDLTVSIGMMRDHAIEKR